MTLTLSYCGLSDIGPVRPNNEDAWLALPKLSFFAIADGMGGEKGGEVASKEGLAHLAKSLRVPIDKECLREAIEQANQWVYQMGCSSELLQGMGSTLCCLHLHPQGVLYGHVGDSRIYRLRNEKLDCLTTDHSYYEKWREKMDGSTTTFSYKHVITRALGLRGKAVPEVVFEPLFPGDLYLLCTDGISDSLSSDEMESLLLSNGTVESIADQFIKEAKNKGGHDNMTLLVIKCP